MNVLRPVLMDRAKASVCLRKARSGAPVGRFVLSGRGRGRLSTGFLVGCGGLVAVESIDHFVGTTVQASLAPGHAVG